MVGLEPAEIWDAGLFGLGAAFVVSRALLVVRNWDVFLHYPMLVLALPSLSYWAMGITGVVVGVYLRRRNMPLLAVMDAWAPCAALLAGLLELGHWLEGSDAGMPWGWRGGLVPVQVIGMVVALVLCMWLLWELQKQTPGAKAPIPSRPMRPEAEASGYEGVAGPMTPEAEASGYEGVAEAVSPWGGRFGLVGGLGLVLGGLAAFLLSMVTQPTGDGWLESGQWIAIGAMIVGVVVWSAAKERV
jgi:phosphatidylglycerol:prolipoprotein diacylglycerol transferase